MRKITLFLCSLALLGMYFSAQAQFLDHSFGKGGVSITDFGSGPDLGLDIFKLPNGKFYVAGAAWDHDYDFLFARFLANGQPDLAFGNKGRVLLDMGQNDIANTILRQSTGKILLSGLCVPPSWGAVSTAQFRMIRLNDTGNPDTTFGEAGKVMLPLTGNGYFSASAILLPDDRILAVGFDANPDSIHLVRLLPDGQIDTMFGNAGWFRFPARLLRDYPLRLAFQPDGRIILGGSLDTLQGDFAVYRILPNGGIDSTFGVNGRQRVDPGTYIPPGGPTPGGNLSVSRDFAYDLSTDALGNIFLLGETLNLEENKHALLAIVKFLPDGSIAGIYTAQQGGPLGGTENSFVRDAGHALEVLPDGQMVAAGVRGQMVGNFWREQFFIAKFKADGALDPSFDTNGLLLKTIRDKATARAVAVFPDNSILVAGEAFEEDEDWTFGSEASADLALLKLHPDGSNVEDFGTEGLALINMGDGGERVSSLLIQPDGSILAGVVIDSIIVYNLPVRPPHGQDATAQMAIPPLGPLPYFALVRYTPDGDLDTAFGKSGKVGFSGTTSRWYFGDEAELREKDIRRAVIALKPDGKILLGGTQDYNFAIEHYNSDGSQDTFPFPGGPNTEITPGRATQFDLGDNEFVTALAAPAHSTYLLDPQFVLAGASGNQSGITWCCYTVLGAVDPVETAQRALLKNVYVRIGSAYTRITALGFQSRGTPNQGQNTLVAGYAEDDWQPNAPRRLFIQRYLPVDAAGVPDLDTSFAYEGLLKPEIGAVMDAIYAMTLLEDGSILAAGAVDGEMAAFRFLKDGAPDPAFGEGEGWVSVPHASSAQAIALQPNGKILLAGSQDGNIVVVRLFSDGAVDEAFGENGVVVTDVRQDLDAAFAVAFQANGGIVAGGYSRHPQGGQDALLLRLLQGPAAPLSLSITTTDARCENDFLGQAGATVNGGFGPYQYSWSNGANTAQISGLSAGVYRLTVTDQRGDTTTAQTEIKNIPDTLSPALTCPPNILSLACDDPVDYALPQMTDNCPGVSLTLVDGMPSGSKFPAGLTQIRYKATDASGNTSLCSFTVEVRNTLELAVSIQPDTSNKAYAATAMPSGGNPPYTFLWYLGEQIAGNGPALISATGGRYRLLVTDSKGCDRDTLIDIPNFTSVADAALNRRLQAFPNPFNQTLNVSLQLDEPANIVLKIRDVYGRLLQEAHFGKTRGVQTTLPAETLRNGIYLLEVWADGRCAQRKVLKAE